MGPTLEWYPVTWQLNTSDEHYRNATLHSAVTIAAPQVPRSRMELTD
jgi:hypothetical protein